MPLTGYLIDSILGSHWAYSDISLIPFWYFIEPILVSHWTHSGTSLSPFWYLIEPILVPHWAHSGISLNPFWYLIEPILVSHWTLSGTSLSPFWYFMSFFWYLIKPILIFHFMPSLVSQWAHSCISLYAHSGISLIPFWYLVELIELWYLTVCPFWYFIEPILVAHWAHSGILGNRVPLMLLLGTYAAMQITMLFEESQWNRNCNNRHNDSEGYKMYWHQQCRKSVRKLFTWIPMFLSMIN